MKRGQQRILYFCIAAFYLLLDLDEKRTATLILATAILIPSALDLDEKRTATLNLLHLPSHITSLDLNEKRTATLFVGI